MARTKITMEKTASFPDTEKRVLSGRAVILLLSEYLPPTEAHPEDVRHIVSVFKLVQELLAPVKVGKGRTQFNVLMDRLPADHKARWFAGAALNTSEQAMASVMSFSSNVRLCKSQRQLFSSRRHEASIKFPVLRKWSTKAFAPAFARLADSTCRATPVSVWDIESCNSMARRVRSSILRAVRSRSNCSRYS